MYIGKCELQLTLNTIECAMQGIKTMNVRLFESSGVLLWNYDTPSIGDSVILNFETFNVWITLKHIWNGRRALITDQKTIIIQRRNSNWNFSYAISKSQLCISINMAKHWFYQMIATETMDTWWVKWPSTIMNVHSNRDENHWFENRNTLKW